MGGSTPAARSRSRDDFLGTRYDCSHERDRRRDHRDGDPVRRRRRGRLRRHAAPGPSPRRPRAATASSSPAPPASRRRSPTTRRSGCFEAVLDEVGDSATVIAGTGSNDTRHTARADRPRARARRRRGARRHPVLQQAQRGRAAGALRRRLRGRGGHAGDRSTTSRRARVINLSPELLAELAAEHDNVVARQAGKQRGARADRGPGDPRRQRRRLRPHARASAARAGSSSPPTSHPARCASSTTQRSPATRERARGTRRDADARSTRR